MNNILKPGYKRVAMGALLAALLPGCIFDGALNCESCGPQEASGVNVANCGSRDVNAVTTAVNGREWSVWVAIGNGNEWGAGDTMSWFSANPNRINVIAHTAGEPYECGTNHNGNNDTSFNFKDLPGIADGDQVTVRLIRIPTQASNDFYEFHSCVEWAGQPFASTCNKPCDPSSHPQFCYGTVSNDDLVSVRDSVDIVYKYSSSASFATHTIVPANSTP